MKKSESISKYLLVLVGLLLCASPFFHRNVDLISNMGMIAAGISLMASTIIENKIIKLIIAILAIIVILYSYFI